MDTIKKAAENGDAKAQFELAKRFDTGDGVEKNLATAFDWFLKAAENENVDAMIEIATRIRMGKGIQRDYEKSKPWFKKAAEFGNPEAQYQYARFFGFTYDYTEIIGEKYQIQENAQQYVEWLERAAKQNHAIAKYSLGMTYMLGTLEDRIDDGSKRLLIEPDIDIDRGLLLLRESADAGYWRAQQVMAILYQSGYKKIKSDQGESDKYWQKFVGHTDPKNQRAIGNQYYRHAVNPFDKFDPQHFFSDKAGKSRYQGRELTCDESNKVAFEWFQKAAAQDDKESKYRLGKMYRDGIGTRKDLKSSTEFFEHAAVMGHQDSMLRFASALLHGDGVVKDYVEAHKWFLRVANLKDFDYEAVYDRWGEFTPIFLDGVDINWARNILGVSYKNGRGVEKDNVLAYAWYNIAASGGNEIAKYNLAGMESLISPEELREAQALSREWEPGKPLVRAGSAGVSGMSGISEKPLKLTTIGSGFYVSHDGNILTNNHVIEGCSEIRVPVENAVAKLIVADQANDLALVKLDVTGKVSAEFSNSDDLKQGEEVFVFGFPLDGYLPSTGNITPGIISALAGPGNNSSLVQITAPVQQGNSGGPLLNKKGKVVGVIVGKANAINIAKVTGDIPQNINFAIAPRTVKSFLDGNRVSYQKKGDTFSFNRDSVEVADEGRKISLKIECWR